MDTGAEGGISACGTVERVGAYSSPLEGVIPFYASSLHLVGTGHICPLSAFAAHARRRMQRTAAPVIFFIFSSTPFSDLCITIVFFPCPFVNFYVSA